MKGAYISIRRLCILILILSVGFALPEAALAGGPVHGARAVGMGTAFNAVADDPSAILFNPAGLTQVKGASIYGGVTAVILSTTYTNLSGVSEETEFQVFFPPHLYVTSDLWTEDLVFGVGLYSPFGIGGRKWSSAGLTRYASTESIIATYSVNPTVAWRALPAVSIAFGLDYMRSTIETERMLDQSASGAADANTRLEADGGGWGYNLGVLLFPGHDVRIGLVYRSAIRINYRGDLAANGLAPALGFLQYSSPVSTTSRFPEIYGLGISYKPTEKLLLAADVELVRWSSFKRMDLDIHQEVPPFADSSTPLDWKDSWQYKIGAEYRVNDTVSLRCGYAYIRTSVPDHTLEPGNPDADQHNFSVGGGYRSSPVWIDGFYNIGVFEDRKVNNAILSGEYKNIIHYVGLSVGRSF